jgi:PIN domain nuclease of toxin-antitoxin system
MTRFLLDTHVFLWLQTAPERLGGFIDLLADPQHDLLLSAASSLEIAVKHGLGKLSLPSPPKQWVPDRMHRSGVAGASVEHHQALALAALPQHHRDPFDRLLICQAQTEGWTLVTSDNAIRAYDVELLWIGT